MRRRTIRWVVAGWLAVAALAGADRQAGAQLLLKTYAVDPRVLPANAAVQQRFESYIMGLHQYVPPFRRESQHPARIWAAEARLPHNPFHPGDTVWVALTGALPAPNPAHTPNRWRFKYYPPNPARTADGTPPVPYGVTYAERDPGAGVDAAYGNKAFDPTDPNYPAQASVKSIAAIQTQEFAGVPAYHGFAIAKGEAGIGTIEVQYRHQGDGRWYSVPVSAVGNNRHGPVVVRFVVSPTHVRPQYASDRALDDDPDPANRIVAGQGPASHYPQLFTSLGGVNLRILQELVRPVFLVGYQRDGDQPPPPPYAAGAAYHFPVAPGAKSPEKDFSIRYEGSAPFPMAGHLRFQPVESPLTPYTTSPQAQRYFPNQLRPILPFEALQFFAPRALAEGQTAAGTITARIPRFQPPSADAFHRDAVPPEAIPSRLDPGRYRSLVRLYTDEPPRPGGRLNARWDAVLFRCQGTRDGQPVVYEQFDRVRCEDPLVVNPGFDPNQNFQVEMYDTFGVEVSVPVERALAVQEETVDVGRAVHGQATVNVQAARAAGRLFGRFVVENQGNVGMLNLKVSPVHLYRSEVDTRTSLPRQMQTAPITANTLLTDIPTPWQLPSAPIGSLSGSAHERYLQVGWEDVAALPVRTKRIAVGQPIGHYSGRFAVYEDLDNDGLFDAGEPFDHLVVKVRVVESPLMKVLGLNDLRWFNALDAADAFPSALLDPDSGRIWMVWSSNREDRPPQTNRQWAQTPGPEGAWNLFSVVGEPVTGENWAGALFDPNYRTWNWDTGTFKELTSDGQPYTRNLYPSVARDQAGNVWLFWHRQGLSGEGASFSQLLYWRGGPGGAVISLPDTRLPKQAPRAFVAPHPANPADPDDNLIWLFWHGAAGGESRLYFNALRDVRGAVADAFSGEPQILDYRVATSGDLVSVKEVAPLPEFQPDANGNNQLARVHLFYAGWSAARENEDVYWSRYDPARLLDPHYQEGNGVTGLPFGRLPFPRRVGERLEPRPARDVYLARHPDWHVTPARGPNRPGFPQTNVRWVPGGSDLADPVLYVVQRGTDLRRLRNGQQPVGPQPIDWDPDNSYFDAQRGEAVLVVAGPDILRWRDVNGDGRIDGNESVPENLTGLRVRLNPAQGTVRFSRPLYYFDDLDDDFLLDPGLDLLYTRGDTLERAPNLPVYFERTGAVSPEALEVFADYTTLSYRVTTDPGSDASPSAAADGFGRLMIVWRRSQEGAPSRLWSTTYTTAVQLNFPPAARIAGVEWLDPPLAGQWNPALGPNNAGLVYFTDFDVGRRVRIGYTGYPDSQGNTSFLEVHRIPGFSPEKMLPLDTVSSETHPFVMAQTVPVRYDAANLDLFIPAGRFWLFWTAGRELLEPVGQQLYRSSDIYFAALAPGFGVGSENADSGGQP